jgi:hypothetical protein
VSSRFRAGHLIRGGAVTTCLKAWHEAGRSNLCWRHVRDMLASIYPESRANSREAVVRIAQAAARVGLAMARNGPDYVPPKETVPDARRLIRDAFRE